jgi:hypothetical protein
MCQWRGSVLFPRSEVCCNLVFRFLRLNFVRPPAKLSPKLFLLHHKVHVSNDDSRKFKVPLLHSLNQIIINSTVPLHPLNQINHQQHTYTHFTHTHISTHISLTLHTSASIRTIMVDTVPFFVFHLENNYTKALFSIPQLGCQSNIASCHSSRISIRVETGGGG